VSRDDGSFTDEEWEKQYWYHGDHLGSAQAVTNVRGEEYEQIEYTSYGEIWIDNASAASNLDIPYRFTGKERDTETGLYYYGARYLDSKTGRWLSTDPALAEYIAGSGIGNGGIYNSINMHTYHYAGNNPIKYTDPDGRADYETMPYFPGRTDAGLRDLRWDPIRDRDAGLTKLTADNKYGIAFSITISDETIAKVNDITGLKVFGGGSITLGNVIIHAWGDAKNFNSKTEVDTYDGTDRVNLGRHEEAHTYQYQKWGLLTPFLIIGSAVQNGGLSAGLKNIHYFGHYFMGRYSFEKAADRYATSYSK
jgi:RHS repeat-associated protein